jgi:hypothetical protein
MARVARTLGDFATLGIVRGLIAGGVLGVLLALTISAALGETFVFDPGAVFPVLIYGAIIGTVLGTAIGLLVGFVAYAARDRFDALWPFAALTVFVAVALPGCVISIGGARPPWSRDALIGCAWALGVGAVLGITAAIASAGIRSADDGGRERVPEGSPLRPDGVPRTRERGNHPIG